MTTATHTAAKADTGLAAILFTAFIGVSIIFMTGFASSQTIHDFEHDTRHATGFPCH
jgi:cobalt transporter subunit CbtB